MLTMRMKCMHEWVRGKHTVSRLYQPLDLIPYPDIKETRKVKKLEEISSKSARLFQDYGIVRGTGPGSFTLLPLGVRSFQKLCRLIDRYMGELGCQKILLPHVTQGSLWQKSGRWSSMGEELLKFQDRHKRDLILSPTHEEAVTSLVAEGRLTAKDLPLRLYQISYKFRDELRPRFGMIRANEFCMKDLYTFDVDIETARKTYSEVCEAYRKIFNHLGVPWIQVAGDTGVIGGSESHEFHYPAAIGQDDLLWCTSCGEGYNKEVLLEAAVSDVLAVANCSKCRNQLQTTKGIEVGHCFLLGEKYSAAFSTTCLALPGAEPTLTQMGCYGIGITRILAAATEVMSEERELRWPLAIAPFAIYLIGPKRGSREAAAASSLLEGLRQQLTSCWPDDVIFDDRDKLTVGRRLQDARRMGYPHVVLMGKKSAETSAPLLELHLVNENRVEELSPADLIPFLRTKML